MSSSPIRQGLYLNDAQPRRGLAHRLAIVARVQAQMLQRALCWASDADRKPAASLLDQRPLLMIFS